MPKLSKFRTTNIVLDEGIKTIPDALWDFNEAHTLMLLENGGGKTTMISLILQTVIPNTRIGKRHISESIARNSNGYVATEWALDGGKGYLVTGFAFKRANTKNVEVESGNAFEYYTFVYRRSEDDEDLKIDNLPFKYKMQGRSMVTTYSEFEKTLREDNRIKVFKGESSQTRNYRKELERHGIHEAEWKNIADISSGESTKGVEDYFAKVDTSEKILKGKFIPIAEDILYPERSEKNQVEDKFLAFQETISAISKLKSDIELYKEVYAKSADLMRFVEKQDNHVVEVKALIEKMRSIHKTFKLEFDENKVQITFLEKRKIHFIEELNDYEWKEKSFQYHTMIKEIEELERSLHEILQKQNILQEKEKQLTKLLNDMNAFLYYNEMTKEKNDIAVLEEELENLTKSQPELMEKKQQVFDDLKEKWNTVFAYTSAELEKITNHINELEKQAKSLSDSNLELVQERGRQEQNIVTNKGYLNKYQKDFDDLKSDFTEIELLNPQNKLNDLNISKEEQQHAIALFNKEEEDLLKEKDALQQKQIDINTQNENFKYQANKNDEKIQSYDERLSLFKGLLLKITMLHLHEFEDKNDILRIVLTKIDEQDTQKSKLSHKRINIEQRLDFLKRLEYFVPNEIILNVQERLSEKGVFATLGSEWLTHRATEDEKKAYLEKFPYLPYSIILEEKDFEKADKLGEKINFDIKEFPVIFISKTHLLSDGDNTSGLLWYSSLTHLEFKDKQMILDEIVKLEAEFLQISEDLKKLSLELAESIALDNAMKDFYHHYTADSLEKLIKEKERLQNEMENLTGALNKAITSISEIDKVLLPTLKKDRNLADKKLQNVVRKQQLLTNFMKNYPNPAKFSEEIQKSNEIIFNLQTHIDENDFKLETLEQEVKLARNKEHEAKEKKRDLGKEKNEWIIPELPIFLSIDFSSDVLAQYNQLKESYKLLLDETKVAESAADEKKKRIQEKNNRIDDFVERLKLIGYPKGEYDYLKENTYEVRVSDTKEVSDTLAQVISQNSNSSLEYKGVETKIEERKITLNNVHTTISRKYGKDPYVYGFNAQQEYLEYKDGQKERKLSIKGLEKGIDDIEKRNARLEVQLESFASQTEFYYRENTMILLDNEMKQLGATPSEIYRNVLNELDEIKESMVIQRKDILKRFDEYKQSLSENEEIATLRFIRDLDTRITKSDTDLGNPNNPSTLFDLETVKTVFVTIQEGIDALRKLRQTSLEQEELSRQQLIDLVYHRLHNVYINVMEIQQNSSITLYGKEMRLVEMRWNRYDKEVVHQNLKNYLEKLSTEIQEMKRNGKSEDTIKQLIKKSLTTTTLIEQYANPIDFKCRVYKPRPESDVGKVGYALYSWEECASWSGGEHYTSCMVMFIVLNNFLRKKSSFNTKENPYKVLIVDNPFGTASSSHIVKPWILLADNYDTQIIAFTALKEEGIREHFNTVISNKYIRVNSENILKSEELQKRITSINYNKADLLAGLF